MTTRRLLVAAAAFGLGFGVIAFYRLTRPLVPPPPTDRPSSAHVAGKSRSPARSQLPPPAPGTAEPVRTKPLVERRSLPPIEPLDPPMPGLVAPPAPPSASPPPLAGTPSTGTTVPITMSAGQLREIQLERLVGLRDALAGPAPAGAKAAAARKETEAKLSALEGWAATAQVAAGELAAARQRLADQRRAAQAEDAAALSAKQK